VINCAADFQKTVEAPFAEDRSRGVTPNPCVVCNREIKWKWIAALFDADAVATGHYASLVRMENGRLAVAEAADRAKDQSYMLCRLTQEQLAKSIFPLGAYTKQEVRRIAECAGLPTAQKRDSQELCFAERGFVNLLAEAKDNADCRGWRQPAS
jgi:tRNA-specific 2-thiouridylase